VRELENVMQRALILAGGDTIDPDLLALPPGLAPALEATGAVLAAAEAAALAPSQPALAANVEPPPAAATVVAMGDKKTDNIRDLERSHILDTLAAVGGSRKLAGERLGMSERTLRHKLKQYREAGLFNG
jgi:two-component system response regulator FlrC